MALLGHSRAWNCSGPERMIRRTRDRQYSWLAEIVKLAPGNVRFSIAARALGVSRQTVLQRVKRGEIAAVHVMRGKQKGLRVKVIGQQTDLFDPIS